MHTQLYIPVFATTLLLSAALLFSVQPLFSKMILPLLGGSPQVWNTAMLFFQICLLGGYAYAHGTTRLLNVRVQGIVHLILLTVFIFVLPFALPEGAAPPAGEDPRLWQLGLMAMTVGGPFFVLAGSAPMLQRWFSSTDHKDADNPYFLYGASNLGSMTSLLAYPFLVEPMMNLNMQSNVWMSGYFGLIGFTALSAVLVWRFGGMKAADVPVASVVPIAWKTRLRWIVLAFIPSSLMLGVTTFITTDIASVPLLWILPLAIYVGTFILVFARKPLLSENQNVQSFHTLIAVMIVVTVITSYTKIHPFMVIGVHFTLFFFAAMVCHAALVKARPASSNLTEFYLWMSFGGALGGFFNAIIAPVLFVAPIEYGLVLCLAALVPFSDRSDQGFMHYLRGIRATVQAKGPDGLIGYKTLVFIMIPLLALLAFIFKSGNIVFFAAIIIISLLISINRNRWDFTMMLAVILLFFPLGFTWGNGQFEKILHRDRNFFGPLKVIDTYQGERILLHGTTNHGAQALDERYTLLPLSYYHKVSSISHVIDYFDGLEGDQNFAVLGLGIGVTACYTHEGRAFDFFEIDREVQEIAENPEFFTYLSDCGSPYEVILGDARLTMARQPAEKYDLILADAFSSDNIPIHLITREAVQMYMSKLKDDGALAFHVSNNYLDMEAVIANIADDLDIPHLAFLSPPAKVKGSKLSLYPTHVIVLSHSGDVLNDLKDKGWKIGNVRPEVKVWSDQYSNILSVFGTPSAHMRAAIWRGKIEQELDPLETAP